MDNPPKTRRETKKPPKQKACRDALGSGKGTRHALQNIERAHARTSKTEKK